MSPNSGIPHTLDESAPNPSTAAITVAHHRRLFAAIVTIATLALCTAHAENKPAPVDNGAAAVQNRPVLKGSVWKHNGFATPRFVIEGTGGRNNPLRRPLAAPFSGDELFVRYRLRYDAASIDQPTTNKRSGNGEFLVCWLDAAEGNDSSTHSNNIPNIGLHVHDNANHFMVRYGSGGERFGPPLIGDRDTLVVARLWKSNPGDDQPFDQLNLWVDPSAEAEFAPHATASSSKALSTVRWIGISTGAKTEIDDRIDIWDIDIQPTWHDILQLPSDSKPKPEPKPIVKTVAFKKDVYPILRNRCLDCHSGEDAENGVRLDSLDEVLNQTSPRNASESHLFQLVANGKMPPEEESLTQPEQNVIAAWINEGLEWDEQLLPTPIPQTTHWSFQPIQRPIVPTVARKDWVRTPVDAFVARRHEQLGLTPAPEAADHTLRRRLALDLTGLPPNSPSPQVRPAQQGEAPLAEAGTQRSPNLPTNDQSLSPSLSAERWARHWLDLARWAESNGYQHNRDRPHAWRYRDWVIDAFASDMPYDEFLRAQLAGDQLDDVTPDSLIATGFLAAARYSGNELDKNIQRNDILVDIVNTTSKAILGLTAECAQCHTHKFDPISIRDYYRLQAVFTKGQPANLVLANKTPPASPSPQNGQVQREEGSTAETTPAQPEFPTSLPATPQTIRDLVNERWRIFDDVHARLVRIKRRQGVPEPIYVIPKAVIGGMKSAERERFQQLDKQIAKVAQTWGYYSPAVPGSQPLLVAPHEMRWPLPRDKASIDALRPALLIRGDVGARGPEVQPGWPAVFGPSNSPKTEIDWTRPRRALAEWITSPDNPLTARVWVNRVWQWHFGVGLVETSGDFGTQGTKPTHPELLDYLASELIDSGWSTQHIHSLIINSATYRQSSDFSAANAKRDPANTALWRWTPRRLEAEAIRDCILAVSGQLDTATSGPSAPLDSKRRSIYLKQRRDNLPHQQMLFDSASGNTSCSRRRVSTTALQPLWLTNSKFMQFAAAAMAKRVTSVDDAVQLAYSRPATKEERQLLKPLRQTNGMPSVCLALLNSSEFLYIP